MNDTAATAGVTNRGELSPLSVSTPSVSSSTAALDVLASESELRDWIALLKPRVLSLVVFTGLIGMVVAPGHLNPVLALAAILSITVAAGRSTCGSTAISTR